MTPRELEAAIMAILIDSSEEVHRIGGYEWRLRGERTAALADELSVSPQRVGAALGRLRKQGLVTFTGWRPGDRVWQVSVSGCLSALVQGMLR